MNRILGKFLLFLIPAFAGFGQWHPSPFPPVEPAAGYVLEQVLDHPSLGSPFRPIGFTPSQGRLFLTDRNGRVLVMTNPASPATVFLDLSATSWNMSDSGLMGFAMHPDGRTCYTFGNETNRVATNMVMRLRKWSVDPGDPNRALPMSEILIEQTDRDNLHTGGALQFGPDGYLYVPIGDEGSQNCRLLQCQTITRDFFGAVLRIDVDGRPGNLPPNPHPSIRGQYWIPSDNPWVGATNFNGSAIDPSRVRTEFWAVGFRNPWKMTFDGERCYLGDVGGVRWEEVNQLVRGGNYGWNWIEGNEVMAFPEATPVGNRAPVPLQPPLWTYPHSAIAPTGTDPRFIGNCVVVGFVYRGAKFPRLQGKLICADYVSKNVWAVSLSSPVSVERIATTQDSVSAIGPSPWDDDILFGEFTSRKVYRLAVSPDAQAIPATLSDTGIFEDLPSMSPTPGVLPYEVASPFWSDHAVKTRWFFLPPGTRIERDSGDAWRFPPGAVWVKHFDLPLERGTAQTRRVETRVTVKTTQGLYGLTYRWREDQSDADLVPEQGGDASFQTAEDGVSFLQPWHFPSRGECAGCHNPVAGHVLGFSTRQLNVPVKTEQGAVVNQLLGLSNLGVFDRPFDTVDGLPRLSRPLDESATLEHRFKSFTDANCAYCHQTGGPARGEWDARFSVPVASSQILGGAVLDDLGVPSSAILSPGDTNRSVLFRRVADFVGHQVPAAYHMPPLATSQRNEAAVEMLGRYIMSLSPRTRWQIGTDDSPSAVPFNPSGEFSVENRINDVAPGRVTRDARDPEFAGGGNPGADDDFYTAGYYPAGFNGLTAPLTVAYDEPAAAWERAHTQRDTTNRMHFVVGAGETGAGTMFRLTVEFSSGGFSMNGITQAGFGSHEMVFRLRTGLGATRVLLSRTITARGTHVVEFPGAMVAAGANTLEVVRTGPVSSNSSFWILYDHLSLESLPVVNTPPTLSAIPDLERDALAPVTLRLQATDRDLPEQRLSYSLVSGPVGMTVDVSGVLNWTPGEGQSGRAHPVTVVVSDDGVPPMRDSRTFAISVRQRANPEPLRKVWQVGTDDSPSTLPYNPSGEFSVENRINDVAPGRVTRDARDPDFAGGGNPGADDDFYTAGFYPAGFNGLTAPLMVARDEPPAAWERAHTQRDTTNRMHFVVGAGQTGAGAMFRLTVEFSSGGFSVNGITQAGFGSHEMVFRLRDGQGTSRVLLSRTMTARGTQVVEFPGSWATAGANTLEIVRTGPVSPNSSFWILYDHLRLESVGASD